MRIAAKFAAWVAGMVLISGGFALVSGDEPKGQESKCAEAKCTAKTCQEKQCQCPSAGLPMLSKIPYVSRLFKNVGIVHEPGCEAGQCLKTPCAEEFERIGIDFECPTCPDGPVLRFGPIEFAFCTEDEACTCPSAGKVAVGKVAVACAAKCCEGKCGEGKCCCGEGKCCCGQCQCAAAIASQTAHKSTACQCAGREELWEHLIELSAEKAAAEAALEAREEHSGLMDALVEMATKSAALEARLEAQAEHHNVLERMVELAVENAQLKARAELAEAKTEMLKETLPVAVEKELLARRVAELEERLAASDAGLRTSKKANGKKAR